MDNVELRNHAMMDCVSRSTFIWICSSLCGPVDKVLRSIQTAWHTKTAGVHIRSV